MTEEPLPRFMNGPKFVAWLTEQGVLQSDLTDSEVRRYHDWGKGTRADLYTATVDNLMTRRGLPISWIPDDVWDEDQRLSQCRSEKNALTAELVNSGMGRAEMAEVLGIPRTTLARRIRSLRKQGQLTEGI